MKTKLLALTALVTALIGVNAIAAPEILFKNAADLKQQLPIANIPAAVNTVISDMQTKNPDLYKIVVYQFNDHFVLYLLSGKYWQVMKVRVDLDGSGKVVNVVNPYHYAQDDLAILEKIHDPAVCPDPKVQFVAISAYPEVGDVTKSINEAYKAANKKYKSEKILRDDADAQTYENWLACPNLKGFFTIGHGSNEEIMVGKGDLISFKYFEDPQFTNLYKNTTLIVNSCEVYNFPFGSQLSFGNTFEKSSHDKNPGPNAKEYVGGYLPLLIGSSEDISACFVVMAMQGAQMNHDTLKMCVGNYDFYYRDFGISHPNRYF